MICSAITTYSYINRGNRSVLAETKTPCKVGKAAHSPPCLFSAMLEYSSSDSCRMIHRGQRHLSPDVSVGRAEEASADKWRWGETAQWRLEIWGEKGATRCPWPWGNIPVCAAPLVPTHLLCIHGKSEQWGTATAANILLHEMHSFVPSLALPVQLSDLVWAVCDMTNK